MKNTLRALFSVSVLALLLTATPVMAAEVDVNVGSSITMTGAESENDNETDVDSDIDVDLDNDANIRNDADVRLNSGHNEQSKNTTGGDLDTGVVDLTADVQTVVNEGTGLCGCPVDGDGIKIAGDFDINDTGYDSENKNELDVDVDVDYDVDNMARIVNNLDFVGNSGHNEQNKNTSGGSTDTGDVTLAAVVGNYANNSSSSDDGEGTAVDVNVAGSINMTGAKSDNTNEFDVDSDYDFNIVNDARVTNNIDVKGNSGHNEQNKNTTGGDLDTGDVDLEVIVTNSVNNSDCCPGLGGSVAVDADFSIEDTGYKSDNKNELDVDTDFDLTVDNDATVVNNITVKGNSGHNEQNKNTSGGSTDTGDVSATLNISSSANNSGSN